MKIPWFVTLVPGSFAITLLQVLQTNPELSSLYGYINASSNATAFLANSNNFTFLAPSNEAIEGLVKSRGNATVAGDLILASLQYGMLKGGYPTLSFSNASQFVSTSLANPAYSNVTGGQVVELSVDDGGNPQVVSGNKTTAAVADELICTGGIIHIIDKFLSIPIQAVLEISAAKLQYFVSILNTAGYLNAEKADYVDGIMRVPDVTYFIPNSAAALAKATLQAANSTAEEMKAVFQYHIVPGFVGYSNVLKDGMRLKTQEGTSLTITMLEGEMYVNSARVVESDYTVANGVIHVIDHLLDRFDNSPPQKASTNSTSISTSSTNSSTAADSTSAAESPKEASSDRKATSSSGIPTSTKIAIGVGAGAGGLTLLAVLILFLIRTHKKNKNKNKHDESDLLSNRGSAPSQMESFYVHRGTILRKDDGYGTEYRVEGSPSDRMSTMTGPEIPTRSPGRTARVVKSDGGHFF